MLNVFRRTFRDPGEPATPEACAYPAGVLSQARLATGRGALLHLARCRPAGDPRVVLLPAYVAEGVIAPFRGANYDIRFYRLDLGLMPEPGHVAALLQGAPAPAVFVLIHYFGYPCGSPELSELLRRHGALVVEDCAHALFSRDGTGRPLSREADIALFSLNKFLPVADGALITSRRPEIGLALDERALPELPPEALAAYAEHLEWGRRLSECGPAEAAEMLAGLGESYERYYRFIAAGMEARRQSGASLELERRYPGAWLAARRVAHAERVHAALRPFPGVALRPELPPGTVPLCVPIRVPAASRGRVAAAMMARGALLSTLADKWDFIPADARPSFAVEGDFLARHLLLPVGECLDDAAVAAMMDGLAALLGELA